MTNYQRTAAWLHACGKQPSPRDLSVQIGCHLEEIAEFLAVVHIDGLESGSKAHSALSMATDFLTQAAHDLKKGIAQAVIDVWDREKALDALCDAEVTGNGVAYLAGFDKEEADLAVLDANDAKLVNGKPVILPGGKIGKPEGWKAADLSQMV